MKVRNFIGLMAVAGLAFAPPAALAQAASAATAAKVDDGALKTRIQSRIKSSATLKDTDVDVAVDNGVVTLTGRFTRRRRVCAPPASPRCRA